MSKNYHIRTRSQSKIFQTPAENNILQQNGELGNDSPQNESPKQGLKRKEDHNPEPPFKIKRLKINDYETTSSRSSSMEDADTSANKEAALALLEKLMASGLTIDNIMNLSTKNSQPSKSNSKEQIPKEQIKIFLAKVFSQHPSAKVLVDITGEDLTTVGRAEVKGSSKKQMRHITPYCFLEQVIKENILNNCEPKSIILGISKYINILISDAKGGCISEELLKTDGYLSIAENVTKMSSKSIVIDNKRSFFLSPEKVPKVFPTPTKKGVAMEKFSLNYTQFTQIAISKLITSIGERDENTLNIVSEELSRILLTVFNARHGVAYPTEGNTLPYEIRYYTNKPAAKAGSPHYEVMQPREIKEMLKNNIKLDGKLRLVNAEGPRVQKVKKALDILTKSIVYLTQQESQNDLNILIKNYNQNYNEMVKLTNLISHNKYGMNLEKYNSALDQDLLSISSLYNHLAKQLFLAFDYKALEDIVLVQDSSKDTKKIECYNKASGTERINVIIKDGVKYRESHGNQSKVTFRNHEEFNLSDFAKKIVNHVFISIFSYLHTKTAKMSDYMSEILKGFVNIISMEYDIDNKYDLEENALDINDKYLKLYLQDIDPEISISIAGENDFSNIMNN